MIRYLTIFFLLFSVSGYSADFDTISGQLVDLYDGVRVCAIFLCLIFGLLCFWGMRIK